MEEWKRQLHSYKEENTRLKVGLIELEAGRGKGYEIKLPLPLRPIYLILQTSYSYVIPCVHVTRVEIFIERVVSC